MIKLRRNQKNKRGVVLFSFYGRSGMWHYATQYSNALSKFKKVYLVCPTFADKEFLCNRVKILEINSSPSIKNFILDTLNIFQHLKLLIKIWKINPSSIHFLDNHPWSIIYALLLKMLGFKIIFTQHDPIQHSGEPRKHIQRIINRLQLIIGDYIVVPSNLFKEYIVKKWKVKEKKVVVYPHGHYAFFLKYKNKGVKEEENTILFFGRILKYKGLDLLLKSLLILKKEGYKFKLIIAGAGDLKPYKKLLEKIKENVEIHNRYIREEEIPHFFQRASIVALTYHDATQSGIIAIAYPFGKPVIATNVGSLPEFVIEGKTGYIVDKNPDEIAKAIKKILYSRSTREEMKNNCKKITYEILDWEKNLKKILYIYD